MLEMLGQIVKKLVELPEEKLGMLYDLLVKLTSRRAPRWWSELGRFLRRENPFIISEIRQEWEGFYREYFHLTVDFSDVQIPNNPSFAFGRLIFIPKDLNIWRVMKGMRDCFQVADYQGDLAEEITENIRQTDKSYAFYIREREEADEELKNLSANKLSELGINCMTFLERLVYGLKYHSETRQHLDNQNQTLCAGSRYRGGRVPLVHYDANDSKLHINWCGPGHAYDDLRARQVFS